MAATALYENSASISTTEYSLPNNSTSLTPVTNAGPIQIWLNLSAMIAGDQYELKLYGKTLVSDATADLIETFVRR